MHWQHEKQIRIRKHVSVQVKRVWGKLKSKELEGWSSCKTLRADA